MTPPLAAAMRFQLLRQRIGNGLETLRQQAHLYGIEHDLRVSCQLKTILVGVGQLRARIATQGTHKDPLGSLGLRAVAFPGAAVALGQAQFLPVGRAIHAAMKASWIDESLKQQQRMAEPGAPIGIRPPLGQRQHPRADVRLVPAGQDQQAAVVGDQVQPTVLRAEVPADPTIADAAFQRCRRQAQLRYPLFAPRRHIPYRLAIPSGRSSPARQDSGDAPSALDSVLLRFVLPGVQGFPSARRW